MMKKFLILSIIAAILVPSMLGYVRKAKEYSTNSGSFYDDYYDYDDYEKFDDFDF